MLRRIQQAVRAISAHGEYATTQTLRRRDCALVRPLIARMHCCSETNHPRQNLVVTLQPWRRSERVHTSLHRSWLRNRPALAPRLQGPG